ncbi:MAG: 50S ribosomal protein L32 [Acidimicrobiia bacterium]|nr:50S ribosomal protein L32 [Acidimicrobiia bacterium]
MKMRPVCTGRCSRCGGPKLPHRACTGPGGCGTYRNRQVVETVS